MGYEQIVEAFEMRNLILEVFALAGLCTIFSNGAFKGDGIQVRL